MYKHIITLEDPIEYLHWHARSLINQREIGKDCNSFADGLRAALREDPDVIPKHNFICDRVTRTIFFWH